MKNSIKGLALLFIFSLTIISCGGGDKKEKKQVKIGSKEKVEKKKEVKKEEKKSTIDLSNKGVGPVTSVDLGDTVDDAMATSGAEIFKTKCTACHKVGKKFIGPDVTGIMERRAPEWTMNMILNPSEMVAKDPIAKQLLIDFNGSPMANQSLTEKEARDILEYFRTLK
ncbi:MAG: cytochrome c [Flavobacteriaceae bacterium]|nr:cytochrome c [Flavobacteriaceae bacterium]